MIIEILITIMGGTIASIFFELISKFVKKEKHEQKDLAQRIKEVSLSLNESATALVELQNELTNRIELVNKLKVEADQAEAILSLTKEQVNAVNSQLQKEGRKSFWKSVFANFIFFVLGAAASFLIAKYLV